MGNLLKKSLEDAFFYEVKYSKEQVSEQYRHLEDDEKCSMTSHRYGDIVGKYVIYRGESSECGDIQYLNVEDYLKSLQFDIQ